MAEPYVALLAAGRGTRFGGNKLETACAGKPLGRWAIEAIEEAGLGPGTVVTGPEGASFAPGWTTLVNPAPEEGLGTSLALAARATTSGYLRELAETPAPAATRQSDGRAGVPALLGRALIERAARLTGDRGAGQLLGGATLLDPPPAMLRDVDTPEDLAEVERQLSAL